MEWVGNVVSLQRTQVILISSEEDTGKNVDLILRKR